MLGDNNVEVHTRVLRSSTFHAFVARDSAGQDVRESAEHRKKAAYAEELRKQMEEHRRNKER